MARRNQLSAFSGPFTRWWESPEGEYGFAQRIVCLCCLRVEREDYRGGYNQHSSIYCSACAEAQCGAEARCGGGYGTDATLRTPLPNSTAAYWRRVIWHSLDARLREAPLVEWEAYGYRDDNASTSRAYWRDESKRWTLHWGATEGGLLVLSGTEPGPRGRPPDWVRVLPVGPLGACQRVVEICNVLRRENEVTLEYDLWQNQDANPPSYEGDAPDLIKTLRATEEWRPWVYSDPTDLDLRARAAHLLARAYGLSTWDDLLVPAGWPLADEINTILQENGDPKGRVSDLDPPSLLAGQINQTRGLVDLYFQAGKGRDTVLTQTSELLAAARERVLARLLS